MEALLANGYRPVDGTLEGNSPAGVGAGVGAGAGGIGQPAPKWQPYVAWSRCGCSFLSSRYLAGRARVMGACAFARVAFALYPPQASSSPDTCPLSVFVCARTSRRFDCILLDIMMVRTNGVDVAVTLRQAFADSATPLPPLVAMTANSSPSDEAMCVPVLRHPRHAC